MITKKDIQRLMRKDYTKRTFTKMNEEEKEWVRTHSHHLTIMEMAEEIGVSPSSMCNFLKREELPHLSKHVNNPWTAEEEERLMSMYGTYTIDHIAKVLGRNKNVVKVRASIMRKRGVEVPRLRVRG